MSHYILFLSIILHGFRINITKIFIPFPALCTILSASVTKILPQRTKRRLPEGCTFRQPSQWGFQMILTDYGLCSAAGIIATTIIVAAAAAKAGTAAAEQKDENENDPQAAASTPRVVTTHIKDPPIQDEDRLLRSQSILCAGAFFVPFDARKRFFRFLSPGW